MHEHCRTVKTHRLIIEQCRSKRREIMKFQICAGIGDQCEARRMGFREPVAREGCNLRDDLFLCFGTEAVLCHAAPQLRFNFVHAFFRTLETHRSTEFFRFAACEVRRNHRHTEQLFLKERHTQSSFQYRCERRMSVCDGLLPLPSSHVGVHHFSDDGARPNDGDLHDEIVELNRGIAWQ